MIICRAPFRISFVGGGTDFEDYYRMAFGAVISATIDKYIYVALIKKFDGRVSLKYSKYECVNQAEDLEHTLVREGLKMFGIESGVEIDIISDIPAAGSGLGSSSALANALLMAFARYQEQELLGYSLARKSCKLEIDILKEPIGKQDQFATAMGGLNFYKFEPEPSGVLIQGLTGDHICKARKTWLEKSTMLFYLNKGRKSGGILETHKREIQNKKRFLDVQRDLVRRFGLWLMGEKSEEYAGELVSASWQCKKAITPEASNEWIDDIVYLALKAGACGAKVCGAGGGGFLLVICDSGKQDKVRDALKDLKELKFGFDWDGTKLIYQD